MPTQELVVKVEEIESAIAKLKVFLLSEVEKKISLEQAYSLKTDTDNLYRLIKEN